MTWCNCCFAEVPASRCTPCMEKGLFGAASLQVVIDRVSAMQHGREEALAQSKTWVYNAFGTRQVVASLP